MSKRRWSATREAGTPRLIAAVVVPATKKGTCARHGGYSPGLEGISANIRTGYEISAIAAEARDFGVALQTNLGIPCPGGILRPGGARGDGGRVTHVPRRHVLEIRVGYELIYDCPQPTPMMLVLQHPLFARIRHHRSGSCDDHPVDPTVGLSRRLRQLVHAPRRPDGAVARSRARPWSGIPASPISSHLTPISIRSRNCPKTRWFFCWAADTATPRNFPTWPGACSVTLRMGWARVQAICDFVHNHIVVRL